MGPPNRAVYLNTLARAIRSLGGEADPLHLAYPALFNGDSAGYVADLTVIHIDLRGEIAETLTQHEIAVLRDLSAKYPENAYFRLVADAWTTGDINGAAELLAPMLAVYWPENDKRLPTSDDRCAEWIWHVEPSEWQPCDQGRTHSCGDLIYLAREMRRLSDTTVPRGTED